jgi:hypothetical protein
LWSSLPLIIREVMRRKRAAGTGLQVSLEADGRFFVSKFHRHDYGQRESHKSVYRARH